MADSEVQDPNSDTRDRPQRDQERLREDVERLWSRDVANELKLSEAKYRALVEGSSDFIYVLDRDGHFIFSNREVENLLGYTPEEIIGRHFSEVLHPEDFQNLGRAFHERRTGERATKRLEVRLRSRGGDTRDVELDIRHFSVSATGIYHDETYWGTHGVARDITERKYQETKRQALLGVREAVWSMNRVDDIQLVLQSIRISMEIMGIPCSEFGVYVLDMDDPPMITLYTSHPEEAIRKRGDWMVIDTERFSRAVVEIWRRGELTYCRDVETGRTPHDRERLAEFFTQVPCIADAPFSHGVLSVVGLRPAAFTPRDLSFLGELAEVLSEGFHRLEDLKEITLSEKRYRTLVETPNLVVMLLDTQSNFLYIGPQIEQWLGYAPEEFYTDPLLIHRIIHPDDGKDLLDLLQADTAQTSRDLEFRWRASNGIYHWASCALFPIYENPDDEQLNRVSMVQMVVQDVTERKHGEELIQNSLEEKEVLLKEIHHRVKNNLQIISSLLHLQASELEDEKVQHIFEDSQHRINSMALIHEELYNSDDLARIEFADYARVLVENLFESYGFSTSYIGLDIQVEAEPLNLDRAIPLGLIINELVSNSLKYAFPVGRQGRIGINLRADAQERFTMTVADDGVGLPAEVDLHQPHSLGLKLVTTLAHQLRAEIELHRERGTTFIISRT